MALTAMSDVTTASASALQASIRRLSTTSPTVPPMSEPPTRSGSCTRLTAPTCKVELVKWYTWYETATIVTWLPSIEASWPANRSRKSRLARSGERSTRIRGTERC